MTVPIGADRLDRVGTRSTGFLKDSVADSRNPTGWAYSSVG